MFEMDVSLESLVSVCILLGDVVHRLVKVPIYAIYSLMILLSLSLSFSLSLSDASESFRLFGQHLHTLGLSMNRMLKVIIDEQMNFRRPLWKPMNNYLSCQSSTKCGVLTS